MKFAEVVGPIQGIDVSKTELRHFVEEQLRSLRDDMIKSNEAVDRHLEARRENEKLLQELENQRVKARELEEKIIRHQEAETEFESRRLLMEQKLKDSQQTGQARLGELTILQDELKESNARLRRQSDELESVKEEAKKQSSLLLEAKVSTMINTLTQHALLMTSAIPGCAAPSNDKRFGESHTRTDSTSSCS